MKAVHICIAGFFSLLPLAGIAQWQWIDKDGKKVFSDQGPPSDIPEKNILHRSAPPSARSGLSENVSVATPPSATASSTAPARTVASSARPSSVDKELEQKAHKAEESEKAARAAEEQKLTLAKADNCTRARQGKATFDSGVRVARLNAQGEREIMDDKARTIEQARVQSVIDSNCS